MVVFEEIPDEITLAINITNCPCKCDGCHSKFLWDDVGDELTETVLEQMINKNKGITCVCFMGGDGDVKQINLLANFVKNKFNLKLGWYSGRNVISKELQIDLFDFVKIGPYIDNMGGLNKKTTNQKMFKIVKHNNKVDLEDNTFRFWKKYR